MTTACNTSTLDPYVPTTDKPWNRKRALHLFRRMGFGTDLATLQDVLAKSPADCIDDLIDKAILQPIIAPPEWADWTLLDFESFEKNIDDFIYWRPMWTRELYNNGPREKMALFWMSHFVTEFGAYLCAPAGYHYLKCLQENALGNFREFVRKIGLEAAMLIYLNGAENTKQQPNENYARELYELFSLGRDNGYTQDDIIETARALTGYIVVPCPAVSFIPALWDDGEKTIFGRTGHWDYDDVIDLLFEEKAELIATYIAGKIYKHFVYADQPNDDIINGLAVTILANDFELVPVMKQLFKSEHFFDDTILGAQIKSPMELTLSLWKEMGFEMTDEALKPLTDVNDFLGQVVFQPPNVAGWPGHRSWISSSFLRSRWQVAYFFVARIFESDKEQFREVAKELTSNSKDPEFITATLINHFTANGFENSDAYNRATAAFKVEIPQGYFDGGAWNLDWEEAPYQVASLMLYILRQPEFQLT
ncbi:MAG: DUF1800 domain-containing protein [Saprospiraceae bacterium]|nr:DUF1800 domain-containing protein [Saprospiraceae bacterium]